MIRTLVVILIALLPILSFGQKEKILTKNGNEALAKGDYEAAAEAYKAALEIDPKYKEASFNLGNLYMNQARERMKGVDPQSPEAQQIAEEIKGLSAKASRQYSEVTALSETPEQINKAQYNLGNAELMGGAYDKSIDAYKEALRKVPTDEDARYNLALAQQLKQQQEQQEQKQDQKQDQEEEKKDDQKQDQKKDKPEDQKQQESQPQKLSKEEAEKMLEALAKQEKDLQGKVKRDNKKVQRIKIEKDW